jgi:cytochrome P450
MDGNAMPLRTPMGVLEHRQAVRAAAAQGRTAIIAETGAIYVFRYHDVEALLFEPRLNGVGLTTFDRMGITGGPLRDWYGSLMFTNEGVPHNRLRRLVGKAFSPRAVERLRPIAAALVNERLARVRAAGGGDLVAELADVAMHVMCALLGVPVADVPAFIAWVDALGRTFGFMDAGQIAAATSAIVELLAYVDELCGRQGPAAGDDLISALIAAEDDGDRLTRAETIAMVANLLVGGHDTTFSQIGCTLLTLLARPQVLALARDDAELLTSMVNETIRFEPAIGAAPRTVVEPFEVCGIACAPGAMVLCSTLTANRDPAIWRNPDAFDPGRFTSPDAPKLLTFGGGPHHCLGAWLARLTLEETVRGVAALGPVLTTPPDEIEWTQSLGSSPARLQVAV